MELKFENKYVAFIDVLGFSALVENGSHDKLQDYFQMLSDIFKIYDKKKKEIQKFAISDSVILVANDNEHDFKSLLMAIRNMQSALAYFNIWVRGGVAYGPVFCDEKENIIVGKGYIRAYMLESQAKYPRVIIDPSILKKQKLNLRQFCEKYNGVVGPDTIKLIHDYGNGSNRLTDNDAIFICYLNKIIIGDLKMAIGSAPNGIDIILEHLKDSLYGPQQHYHKYLWLKKHIQEILQELNHFTGKEALDKDRLNKYLVEFGSL